MKLAIAACTAGLLAAATAVADDGPRVRGKPALPEGPKVAAAATAMRHATYPAAMTRTLRLAPIPAPLPGAEVEAVGDEKRERVGVRRDVMIEKRSEDGPRALHWMAAPAGGRVARMSLTSPGAAGLRLGMSARELPANAELRFLGTDSAGRIEGPVPGADVVSGTRAFGMYWSPVTEGESQTVEVWIPAGADPERARITLDSASHLAVPPARFAKSSGVGAAQACNQDVVCAAPGNEAVAKAARATAKLVFTENSVTYLCSATLINDGNPASQVPYLYTAAHCIGSQAAAATLNTIWFFEATACGGKAGDAYRQLSRGGTLLYANAATDAALVRLSERAPEGAWFSGWDAAPLQPGSALLALHHPAGDLKKLTAGQAVGLTQSANGASFTNAAWLMGSTQGGSSGSGLFTRDGDEYLLRGGLRGGSASCDSSGRIDNPANRDYYSRLEAEAAALRVWLDAAAAPLDDYTGMWWNPDEPGWGVSIMQNAANKIFIAWYTYDAVGQPTWLVLPAASWRSATALEGKLYRATGTAFDRPYEASRFSVASVGEARIEFGAGDRATLTVRISGRDVVKPLRRQPL